MREINDQYPEYAEPYEPVKGGKHHKGLYGTSGPDRRRKRPGLFLFFDQQDNFSLTFSLYYRDSSTANEVLIKTITVQYYIADGSGHVYDMEW